MADVLLDPMIKDIWEQPKLIRRCFDSVRNEMTSKGCGRYFTSAFTRFEYFGALKGAEVLALQLQERSR